MSKSKSKRPRKPRVRIDLRKPSHRAAVAEALAYWLQLLLQRGGVDAAA